MKSVYLALIELAEA